MKVLLVANSDVGLYKFRKEVILALLEKGEVYICLPNGKYIQYFIDRGCKFIDCEFDSRGKNPIRDIKLHFFYQKIVKSIKPEIVFTYTIKPNVYCGAVCASLKIPYVANITGLGTALENKGFLQRLTMLLYKNGLRNAKKVFFQNEENREFMLKHKIVNSSYDVLPGSGVNLDQYKVLTYPCNGTVDFVFISRIMKEKGIDQYLEAAEHIRKKYLNTRFHVCGFCGSDYQEKIERYHAEGIIIYHGMIDDITEIHRISSCTVHPTYYPEGLSNVLLESCACGRPIITTNRSGCREIVEDGVNGFIVNQMDSVDLIDKIEKFLCLSIKERNEMGLCGRAKVEKFFDRQIVVDKYLEECML